ncbi:hypothetical protein MSI_16450 [Treponema sp. JC4]|uniref:hypothetical protein n=1 Tax=Treponema sp. JC4 TaxID=1124982 RepID=UPI00025AFC08|nr:hypothetical protein [Treponema sp. JC4]EID84862.1 hypothetical protein MSI_16450 [Treponema sp. JC4]
MNFKMNYLFRVFILVLFVSCANGSSDSGSQSSNYERQNLANFHVANWSKYTAIGAGIEKHSSSRAVISIEPVSRLVGITEDGIYETVTFNDEEGNLVEQKMNLAGFKAFKKFTFIAFSFEDVKEIGAFNNRGPNTPDYVLYNPTGKIYSLDMFEDINLFTHSVYDESENEFFFYGRTKNDNSSESWIYELSVENEKLAVRKRIDTEKINGWRMLAADRFGNLYSYTNNWDFFNYILTKEGELKTLDGGFYKGMNNIVYELQMNEWNHPEGYKSNWINNEGILEPASFIPENYFYNGISYTDAETYKTRILKKENYSYYVDWPTEGMKIIEIAFLDDEGISYSYKEVLLPFATGTYLVANERLYFLDNDKIFYVDIKKMDGVKHTITSAYFFKTITADKLGNIYFTGVDSKLNDITGKIDISDNVEVTTTETSFEIIYLNPVN